MNDSFKEISLLDIKRVIKDLAIPDHAPFTVDKDCSGARYTYYQEINNKVYLEIKTTNGNINDYNSQIIKRFTNTNYKVKIFHTNRDDYSEIIICEITD